MNVSSMAIRQGIPESTIRNPQLSIIIPVYNEIENLEPLWDELHQVLHSIGRASETIFVDDGSNDGSAEILSGIHKTYPEVRVLHLHRNTGQSAALLAGIQAARGEIVVMLDGDRQNDPSDIPELLSRIPEYDAVAGFRRNRADNWLRRVSGRISNLVRNSISGDDIIDTGCSLKAFRRECLARIPAFNGMHRFLPTLVRMAGYRVCQVPVRHRPRIAGRSKYGIGNRLIPAVSDLMAVRWMKRRRVHYTVNEEE